MTATMPEQVRRYDHMAASMVITEKGSWVRYSDYEKLQAKCGNFQKLVERGDLFNRCLELEADRDRERGRAEEAERKAHARLIESGNP